MATLFSTNFTAADSTDFGANWTEGGSNSGVFHIVSNKARVDNAGGAAPAIMATTSSAHADTADVGVSIALASTSGDGGPIARCTDSDTTPRMYALDVFAGGYEVHRYDGVTGGSAATLASGSLSLTANGIAKLEVSGTGATVTLRVYYNGVQLGSDITDSSGNRITTAGRTGFHSWVTTDTATADFDDFLAESLSAAAAVVSVDHMQTLVRPFPYAPSSPRGRF